MLSFLYHFLNKNCKIKVKYWNIYCQMTSRVKLKYYGHGEGGTRARSWKPLLYTLWWLWLALSKTSQFSLLGLYHGSFFIISLYIYFLWILICEPFFFWLTDSFLPVDYQQQPFPPNGLINCIYIFTSHYILHILPPCNKPTEICYDTLRMSSSHSIGCF